jgi:hypothetical protein
MARFSKKKNETLLNTKCVFWFPLQLLSEKFLILRRSDWDMIKNVYWIACEVPSFLSDFNATWNFSADFRKIFKYQISSQCVQWGDELFHTDRGTDITRLQLAFSNSAKAPTNYEIVVPIPSYEGLGGGRQRNVSTSVFPKKQGNYWVFNIMFINNKISTFTECYIQK